MNKSDYMTSLTRQLRRLPKEDLRKALDYFEEYFEEAGPEKEEQAIEDLGTPDAAAEQIITNLALANAKEPVQNVKKGLNAVWVSILAICAAPIALPFTLFLVAVAVVLILAVLIVIASVFLMGVILVLLCPASIVAAFLALPTGGFPVFLTTFGASLFFAGAGVLICRGSIQSGRSFLTSIIRLFGNIIHKGGKTHE